MRLDTLIKCQKCESTFGGREMAERNAW